MVDFVSDPIGAVFGAFGQLSSAFIGQLPLIFAAIILIVAGFIIGWLAKLFVVRLLRSFHLDDWIVENKLSNSIGNKKITEISGSVLKWYVFFVFLKQAVSLVSLSTISEVLGFWINFGLTVIAAVVVIIAGLIIARYVRNAIELTTHSFRKIAGLIVEVAIVYVAVVMGIKMIGLPTEMLEWAFLIAFAGFILALALIVGLSFGLAMQGEAKIIIKELRKKK